MAEAGFFPASAYLLTTWYRRLELQRRLAIFYSAGALASAFSGLLAFAIGNMDGIRNMAGWRWIFLIEGVATVGLSGVAFFLLPDSPETARFLSAREKKILYDRLRADAGTESGEIELHDKFHWPTIKTAFTDWKIWVAIVIFWVRLSLTPWCMRSPRLKRGLGAHHQSLWLQLHSSHRHS